jgi:hypothetical protein
MIQEKTKKNLSRDIYNYNNKPSKLNEKFLLRFRFIDCYVIRKYVYYICCQDKKGKIQEKKIT